MTETDLNTEIPRGGEIHRWIPPGFKVDCDFGAMQVKIISHLNSLLSLVELRRYNTAESPFDNDLLRRLRDGVTEFRTSQKPTSQHLPLPRPEISEAGYTYRIGENEYSARDITPGFHSSQQFLDENRAFLGVGDFSNEMVHTTIDSTSSTISVEKHPFNRSAGSIIQKVKPTTYDTVYKREFDTTQNDLPWSIEVLTDKENPNSHYIEFVVKTAEAFRTRREHLTPYVVKLNADRKTMQDFLVQLNNAIAACTTPIEQHTLLYLLTSVCYFQSDPEYPYMTPDVKPGNLNGRRHEDLFTTALRFNTFEEIQPQLDRLRNNPDGIAAMFELYSGRKPGETFEEEIAELKAIFGNDYELLASEVKRHVSQMARQITEAVNVELEIQVTRGAEFDRVWQDSKDKCMRIIADAIGLREVNEHTSEYQKLLVMMDFENNFAESRRVFSTMPQANLSNEMNYLQKNLIICAMSEYMQSCIEDIVHHQFPVQKKPEVKRDFIVAWNELLEKAHLQFGISKSSLVNDLCDKLSQSARTVDEVFEEKLALMKQ